MSPISRAGSLAVVSALVLGALVGCGDDAADDGEGSSTETTGGDATAVTVTAGPDGSCTAAGGPVETGLVDVSYVNESDDPLFVFFLYIEEGSFADAQAALAEFTGELPEGVALASTSDEVASGQEAEATVAMTNAGEYLVQCAPESPPTELPATAPAPIEVRG